MIVGRYESVLIRKLAETATAILLPDGVRNVVYHKLCPTVHVEVVADEAIEVQKQSARLAGVSPFVDGSVPAETSTHKETTFGKGVLCRGSIVVTLQFVAEEHGQA